MIRHLLLSLILAVSALADGPLFTTTAGRAILSSTNLTGAGITNTAPGTLAANLAAGANVTLTTGANGQISIAASGGGGGAGDNWTSSGTTNSTLSGIGSGYQFVATNAFSFPAKSQIQSTADGYVMLLDNAGTSFTGLRFGGTSSSFPMLKRSSALFELKLADDSAYARLTALDISLGTGFADLARNRTGLSLGSGYSLFWSSTTASSGSPDVGISRDAAGFARITDGSTGAGSLRASAAQLDTVKATNGITALDVTASTIAKFDSNKKLSSATLGTDVLDSTYISDTAFASGWNGVTTIAPTKNAVYDQLHIGDTDDDGLADKLDLGTAGVVRTTSGGVISSAELSGDVTTSGSNAATIAAGAITEANGKLTLSDVTTLNASTSKHGFAPKLPNDATKFLDGTGAFTTPSGTGGEANTASNLGIGLPTFESKSAVDLRFNTYTNGAGINISSNANTFTISAVVTASEVSDTAFASSWNGVTAIAPSKNAVYDWAHTFDTDDDGKVNVLDLAAGIPKTDSSGVLSLATLGTDYLDSTYISDTAFASSWNGVTTIAPSKNAVYDQLHIGDTDDDGKIDVLDNVTAAGFLPVTSGGVPVQARTLTEGLAIDITNPTGAAGDPTIAFDPTELTGDRTWSDGSGTTVVWTWDLSGTDPAITFGSSSVDVTTGTLKQGGTAVALQSRALTVAGTSLDIVSSAGSQTLAADRTWTLSLDRTATLAGNPALAASTAAFATTGIIFEGATADTIEGLLTAADQTGADHTWTLPNADTFVPIAAQVLTFAGPTAARTITFPDAAITVARTDAANTFTGHQTIEGVTSTGATGTGKFVFDGSPTIVTPTIADFSNSTHTHLNNAGGGTLSASAIASGTLSAARLPAVIIGAVVTLTDASTVATDASLGNLFRVTLGGNRTLGNPTNPTDGQRATWELIQDGTGSRTLALDTQFAFGTDITSVTLTTTASKRDFLTAIYNSTATKWYVVGFIKGF
jgi:hypothetical protein